MKANEVIKIGRRRRRAASTTEPRIGIPSSCLGGAGGECAPCLRGCVDACFFVHELRGFAIVPRSLSRSARQVIPAEAEQSDRVRE
jgi:hypothetical protein